MKKTFQLEDLTCPSCVVKIKKGLSQLEGIQSVNVRFNSSKVDVTFDDHFVEDSEITKRLANIGFKTK